MLLRAGELVPGAVIRFIPARESGPFTRGFHLVRTEQGPAALADPYECALQYDRRSQTFGCAAGEARSNLHGRQVAVKPRSVARELDRLTTRVNSEKWILVATGGDLPLPRIDVSDG